MAAPSNFALTKNEVITEILSCNVCYEGFENKPGKAPKMLSCHHTFCASCLRRVLANNNTISCPSCRTVTTVGAGGVDGLSSNLLISRLSDAVEEAADDTQRIKKRRTRRGYGEY